LIRAQGASEDEDDTKSVKDKSVSEGEIGAILHDINEFADDLKKRVKENEAVAQGAQTLLRRYKAMRTCKFANSQISSALHRFGWVFGGSVKSTQGDHSRRGRRIPVNALAAGWQRGGSKGNNFSTYTCRNDCGKVPSLTLHYVHPKTTQREESALINQEHSRGTTKWWEMVTCF